MTMQPSCTVHCRCISACNADQTRPDPTRPDPSSTSPLRANTLLLLPQLQKAVHKLWKSAIEGMGMSVPADAPTAAARVRAELARARTTERPTPAPNEGAAA